MDLISYPFRLEASGAVATVASDSDAHYSELLAVLCLTHQGDRPLVPEYGLSDPTFDTIEPNDLMAAVALYGPPVSVTTVEPTYPAEGQIAVSVSWVRQ